MIELTEELATGVSRPCQQTVTVQSTGNKPVLLNVDQALSAHPYLPGLQVQIARLFQ